MTKPVTNSAAICAAILFIEGNLGAYLTKAGQIAALNDFTATQRVEMSAGGYDPYTPTGAELRSLLKSTVMHRRTQGGTSTNDEGAVTQLFTIGRSLYRYDYLRRLNLPSPTFPPPTVPPPTVPPLTPPTTPSVNPIMQNTNPTINHTRIGSSSSMQTPSQDLQIGAEKRPRSRDDSDNALQTNVYGEDGPAPKRSKASPPPTDDVTAAAQEVRPDNAGSNDHRSKKGKAADIRTSRSSNDFARLHQAIESTAGFIFPGDFADQLAQPDLHPCSGLKDLYDLILATEEGGWKSVALDLQNKRVLTGHVLFQSLLWAYVEIFILGDQSDFSDLHQLLDASKVPGRCVDQVLRSQYGLNMANFRHDIFAAQSDDELFQRETVAPKAAILANDLMLILAGHIDQIDKSRLPHDWCKDLSARLKAICHDALLLLERLRAQLREWNLSRFESGEDPSGEELMTHPRFSSGRLVAFTIMPGLEFNDARTGTRKYRPAPLVAMDGEDA